MTKEIYSNSIKNVWNYFILCKLGYLLLDQPSLPLFTLGQYDRPAELKIY